jgi:3-dehydroquinate synthase
VPIEPIRVTGLGEPYDVVVERGVLSRLVEHLPEAGKVVLVTNETLADLHADAAAGGLEAAGREVVRVTVPDGEGHKTPATLCRVYDEVLKSGIERGTPLIGLGGGVVTDLAGFAAATLLRGLPYVAVPTSLLAMVDASVGGKTGVNHPVGKNLIGAFYPACGVVIDPDVLSTLPPAELRAGLAECVKHDVIRDCEHLATMEAQGLAYLAGDVELLSRLVAHNVAIKAGVVAEDPYEQGVRAHLNLGHTFGHAFEKATGYAIRHGEAVAIGMACACRVSSELGLMTQAQALRVTTLLSSLDLPTRGVRASADVVLSAMRGDKKVRDGRVRFVLPEGLGAAVVRDDVSEELVRSAVEEAVV